MIDRELLFRAWPDGYLARRGVSTVGGWLCEGDTFYRHNDEGDPSRVVVSAAKRRSTLSNEGFPLLDAGDLLPNVDPTDPATWACLLQDLAEASRSPTDRYDLTWSNTDKGWRLFWQHRSMSNITGRAYFDIDTDDPTLALVRARIQLQEATGKIAEQIADRHADAFKKLAERSWSKEK